MSTPAPPAAGPSRRFIVTVGVAILLLSALPWLFSVNQTESVAPGVYFTPPIWTPGLGELAPGDLVVACPPAGEALELALVRGYVPASLECASGARPFLKRILAVPGQTVRLDTTGLWIGGERALLAPPTTDSRGRAVEPAYADLELPPGALWLGSDAERGFDSRYLGPFQAGDVRARAFLAIPF